MGLIYLEKKQHVLHILSMTRIGAQDWSLFLGHESHKMCNGLHIDVCNQWHMPRSIKSINHVSMPYSIPSRTLLLCKCICHQNRITSLIWKLGLRPNQISPIWTTMTKSIETKFGGHKIDWNEIGFRGGQHDLHLRISATAKWSFLNGFKNQWKLHS